MRGAGRRRGGLDRAALLRAVSRHRALLSAGLVAGAVATGLTAVAPPPPARAAVLVAAADLDAQRPLRTADVSTVSLPPDAVPDGALRPGDAVDGRLLAGPVRRGEPLTDVRLVGPGLLSALGAAVAAPVRVADAGEAALVRPGDRVDVLAASTDPGTGASGPDAVAAGEPAAQPLPTGPGAPEGTTAQPPVAQPPGATAGGPPARVVARSVVVVAVPGRDDVGGGALVVVATSPEVAAALAAAAVTSRLSLTLRGGP